jgi:hypothetical protein
VPKLYPGHLDLHPADFKCAMYLFYLDESGNTGTDLDSTDQPIHWLVALAMQPHVAHTIGAALWTLTLRFFPDSVSNPDFEFHGSYLFSGRGSNYAHLTPAQRVQVYEELVSLVFTHDCHIFVRGINKAGHKARAAANGYTPDHPHTLGFMYLAEQCDEWLAARQPGTLIEQHPPVLGLVVADESRETYRDVIRGFAHWRHYKTTGYRARTIQYLIDTVHYVQSQDSSLIQLADCVAYLRSRVGRVWRGRGTNAADYTASEAAVARLWLTYCSPKVVSDRVWP